MPIPYGPFTLSAGQVLQENIVQYPNADQIVIMNLSPYTLRVDGGTLVSLKTIAPFKEDAVKLGPQFSGQVKITPSADLNTASTAPSFVVYITAYAAGEELPGVYPSPLPIVAVGGGVLSTVTNIVNRGNAAPSAVLAASPQPINLPPSLEALINNDGSTYFGAVGLGGHVTWDTLGNITASTLTVNAPPSLQVGAQETGMAAVGNNNGVTAGLNPNISGVNPKTIWHAAPSSIVFTTDASTNVNAPFASDLNANGFGLAATQPANGFSRWLGSWATTGL